MSNFNADEFKNNINTYNKEQSDIKEKIELEQREIEAYQTTIEYKEKCEDELFNVIINKLKEESKRGCNHLILRKDAPVDADADWGFMGERIPVDIYVEPSFGGRFQKIEEKLKKIGFRVRFLKRVTANHGSAPWEAGYKAQVFKIESSPKNVLEWFAKNSLRQNAFLFLILVILLSLFYDAIK